MKNNFFILKATSVVVAVICFSGCASWGIGQASNDTLQSLTTGAVPCAKNDITIIDKTDAEGANVWSWVVQCDDTQYFCSKGTGAATQCSAKK